MQFFNEQPLYEDMLKSYEPGLQTGLGKFDEFVGGLKKGKLYIVSAPTGAGKTTFMIAMAMRVARMYPDEKVLFIATEQDAKEIKVKFLSSATNIEQGRVESGNLDENEMKKVLEAEQKMSNIAFQYYEDYDFDLKGCLDEAVEMGIKYVFYDYLGALVSLNDVKLYQTLEKLTDDIKRYATQNNIFIMTATQCSNDINNLVNIPDLFTEKFLANSKGIARKADVGFILYRIPDSHNGEAFLDMYKNRWAGQRRLEIRLDYAKNRIYEK